MSDAAPPRKSFFHRVVAVRLRDILVLFLLCVLAGVILALFNIDPAELWVDFFGTIGRAWDRFFIIVTESLGWSVRYFLLGAVLVVPIWIVWRLIAAAGRRS